MNTALLSATVVLTAILLSGCGFKGALKVPETGSQTVPTEPVALATAADEVL